MDLLLAIAALSADERRILLDEIFESGVPGRERSLLRLLKGLDAGQKAPFYVGLSASSVNWFEEQVRAQAPVTEAGLREAEAQIGALLQELPSLKAERERHTTVMAKTVMAQRGIMKANFLELRKVLSDQTRGVPRPPLQKEYGPEVELLTLPPPSRSVIRKDSIFDCIAERKSRRRFTKDSLSLEELSFLLWATQGRRRNPAKDANPSFRTVPSGGARCPFETYLAVNRVAGLTPGLYNYLPLDHKLAFLHSPENLAQRLTAAALGQEFVGDCAVCYLWSAIPYRCEWRYTLEAKKIILQDSGHLGQNLYLAAEALECGTCAIGAYDQKLCDELLNLDGHDEFVVYLSPVGRPPSGSSDD